MTLVAIDSTSSRYHFDDPRRKHPEASLHLADKVYIRREPPVPSDLRHPTGRPRRQFCDRLARCDFCTGVWTMSGVAWPKARTKRPGLI